MAADLRVRWHLELVDQASSRVLRQDRAIRTSLEQTSRAQSKLATAATKAGAATVTGGARAERALKREDAAASALDRQIGRLNAAQRAALTTSSRLASNATRTASGYRTQETAARRLASAERARASAQGAGGRLATGAAAAGAGLTGGLQRGIAAAAGGGVVASAVATFAGFEQQMDRVQAVSGATSQTMGEMTKQAQQLGADTSFSAREAADGMYQLSTAGFKANEVMRAIPGTLDLAAASGTDLASAAELQATTLRGFGLAAGDAGRVADSLATTVNRSAVEMADLQDSIKYIAPVARATGQNMESMLAALGLMGNVGVKGSQAGTTLRTALVRLTAPTEKSRDALHELGIKAGDLRGPRGLLPLPQILAKITTGAQGVDKGTRNAALAAIFGREALSGMVAMVDAGPAALDRNIRALQRSEGQAKRTATVMRDNVAGAWDTFTGSLETAAITLTERWGPKLRDTLKGAAGVVNDLAESLGELGTGLGRGAAGEPAAGPRRGGPPVPELHPQHRGRLRDQPGTPRLIPELPRGARDPEQAEREEARRRTPRLIRAPRSAVVQRNLGQPRAPSLGGARDEDRTPILRRVGAVAGAALATAGKAVGDAGRQLLDAIKPAVPFLQNVLLPLLEGIGKGILISIVGAFKTAVPIIKVVATVLGAIGRAAAPVTPIIRGIGTVIGFIAGGPILKAISGLRAFGLVGRAVALAARVLYAPLRLVGSVFGVIGRGVGSALSAIGRFVGRAASIGARITEALAGAIGGLPGRLLGFATRAASSLARGLGRAVGFARSAGGRIIDGIWNAIVRLPGRIARLAGTVATAMGDLGRGMVRAVVNAVKASPGAVVDAIKALIPGPLRGALGAVGGAVANALGFRGGGMIRRQAGGLVPAAVSPGELVTYGGAGWTVPGSRTAADSVGALLPAGAAVWTDHGQRMLAAGVDPETVLATQLPHFARGGVVGARDVVNAARAARFKGRRLVEATAVSFAEDPSRKLDAVSATGDYGLWQINKRSHPQYFRRPGRIFDPVYNATAAYAISSGGRNWQPWTTWRTGDAQRQIGAARSAVHAAGGPDAGAGAGGSSDTTVNVPLVLGRSRTRGGLLPDAFAQGRTAGQAGLTRGEIAQAGRGVVGARANPLIEAIRGAMTATTRESTIPGAGGAGDSASSAGGDARMSRMSAFARRASSRFPNYHYGGGHSSFTGPYDCSGFVGAILHAGGFLNRTVTTDQLKTFGVAGGGKRITIGVRGSTGRNAHTMIRVGRDYWEAGSHGVGHRTGWSGTFPIRRHPGHYRAGGIVGSSSFPSSIRAIIGRHGRAAFDPRSPFYVGEGLRTGGIVGYQAGGTVLPGVGPRVRRGVAGALSNAGGSLAALDAILGETFESRLLLLRREIVAAVRRGGSKKTVQRLQSVLDLIDGELGRRVGEIERRMTQRTAFMERAHGAMDRQARRIGLDSDSSAGISRSITTGGLDELAARAQVSDARRALQQARRAGAGTEALDELQTGLNTAQDELDEVLVSQIERRRELIRQQAQEHVDTASFGLELAQGISSSGEAAQRIARTTDTAQGMLERATNVRGQIIPAIQGLIGAQRGQLAAAIATGDVAGQRAASLAIQSSSNDLANAIADAADLVRDAAVRVAQDIQDAATHRATLANTGLQRLELEQRLAGTFDSGNVARAQYITQTVMPALQGELAAIVERERVYREQGMLPELRQAIEEEAGKRNELLQAQLDAQEQIAANTDPRKFGGTLGLGYGGNTITDDLTRAALGV